MNVSSVDLAMSPHACVASSFGELHIYTLDAMQMVLDRYFATNNIGTGVESIQAKAEVDENDVGNTENVRADRWSVACAPRFEGFTARQWAIHSKKKASIASQVCCENGKLKALIEDLTSREKACSQDRKHTDPLQNNDPWQCAESDTVDQRLGSPFVPVEVKGDWRALPDCAWHMLYSKFDDLEERNGSTNET